MRVEVAIPCVNYDDLLQLTLARNLALLQSVTVVTSPTDSATIALAHSLGLKLVVTDAWGVNGPFNKARALNEWIDQQDSADPDLWLMTLDADIVLPPHWRLPFDTIDPRGLHSAHRRVCASEAEWTEFTSRRMTLDDFPLDLQPVINEKVWGDKPTKNSAGLCGYLHVWNPARAAGMKRFPEAPSAAQYDVEFALSFPEDLRTFISGVEVLHLGMLATDWEGRRSPRWSTSASS